MAQLEFQVAMKGAARTPYWPTKQETQTHRSPIKFPNGVQSEATPEAAHGVE